MSSRALRKAQREREEQAQIQPTQDDVEDEEEDIVTVAPKKSAFAMLEDLEQDEDEPDEDDDQGGVALEHKSEPAALAQTTPSKKSKKKKKKAKTKQSVEAITNQQDDDLDEIDAALRDLAMSNTAASATTSLDSDPTFDEACALLAIDRNHLHAQNEIRKLFGRTAMQEEDAPEQEALAGGNRRQQRRVQQVGLAQALRGQQNGRQSGMASISLRRNLFIQGKEEWPVATSGGLGMEIVNKSGNGTVEYRYVHNRTYQDVQLQFDACVASMDPNRLVVLLQHNPYHISTLLQVSEIAKSERDHTTSGDLLERALFSMGRAIHSTFAKNLADGKARLDFRRPENREFWLASWRYMLNLSMRGTWRTVYEWAKLLLALSPEDDPYALWLTLDQYALRSKADLDYINLSRNALFKHVHESMPNILLSQGLAETRSGNKAKGQQVLFSTMSQYPWFVARLFQELDLDAPPAIWGKEARTDKERLYAELYAIRAKDIWNTPENTRLLVEIASAVPPEAKIASPDTDEIRLNEARHAVLSDTPALIAMVPKKYTSQLTSVSDPLPPPDSINSYVVARETRSNVGSVPEYRELQQLNSFFQNLLPRLRRDAPDVGQDTTELQADATRRLEESGYSEADLLRRLERMRELGTRDFMPVLEAIDDEFDRRSEDEDNHHARVEDASDED